MADSYFTDLARSLEAPYKDLAAGLGQDPEATILRALSSGLNTPITSTKTRYGVKLLVNVGSEAKGVIGGIQKISPRQSRATKDEFELSATPTGLPNHVTPGNVTSRTIAIDRYEIYRAPFWRLFGHTAPLICLCDQRVPITVRVQTELPLSSSLVSAVIRDPSLRYQVVEYKGCYFTDLGETYDVGNVIVGFNGTLTWSDVRAL